MWDSCCKCLRNVHLAGFSSTITTAWLLMHKSFMQRFERCKKDNSMMGTFPLPAAEKPYRDSVCVCLYMDAPAGNEWWCTVHACRYTYLQTSAYGSRRRGRLGRLLWNLFGYIFFILVAIGFTGQNGMWPNERYFDPSSELTVLLEELCMAQDIFYKVVRNPPAAFAKS